MGRIFIVKVYAIILNQNFKNFIIGTMFQNELLY
jgi:hypothetical protein